MKGLDLPAEGRPPVPWKARQEAHAWRAAVVSSLVAVLPTVKHSPLRTAYGRSSDLSRLTGRSGEACMALSTKRTRHSHYWVPDCVLVTFRLQQQVYLHPYRKELMLRNYVQGQAMLAPDCLGSHCSYPLRVPGCKPDLSICQWAPPCPSRTIGVLVNFVI